MLQAAPGKAQAQKSCERCDADDERLTFGGAQGRVVVVLHNPYPFRAQRVAHASVVGATSVLDRAAAAMQVALAARLIAVAQKVGVCRVAQDSGITRQLLYLRQRLPAYRPLVGFSICSSALPPSRLSRLWPTCAN